MEIYKGRGTVIKQVITAIACLITGLGIIKLFSVWVNTWQIYFPDSSQNGFFWEIIFSIGGLVFLIIFITYAQFSSALSPSKVFRLSMGFAGFEAFIAFGCLLFISLLVGTTLQHIMLATALFLMLFGLLGFITGSIQAFRLWLEGFNPTEQAWLISNEADLQASKLGVLPYRQQVETIWSIIFFILLSVFSIAAPIMGRDYVGDTEFGIGVFIVLIWVGVCVAMIIHYLKLLSNPSIKFIEGQVSKTLTIAADEAGTEILNLTCNGEKFRTNRQTWDGIIEGGRYQLWYSPINNSVIAFEESNKAYLNKAGISPIDRSQLISVKWLLVLGTVSLAALWWGKRKR